MESTKKEDRRIKRTKDCLKQSLLNLLKTKKIDDITILDITNQSNIGRSTFYLHYHDIYGLLEDLEQDVLSTYMNNYQTLGLKQSFLTLCSFIKENQNFVTAFHTTSTVGITRELLTDAMEKKHMCTDTFHLNLLDFISSGNKSVLEHWLAQGCDTPVEDIAVYLTTISEKLIELV